MTPPRGFTFRPVGLHPVSVHFPSPRCRARIQPALCVCGPHQEGVYSLGEAVDVLGRGAGVVRPTVQAALEGGYWVRGGELEVGRRALRNAGGTGELGGVRRRERRGARDLAGRGELRGAAGGILSHDCGGDDLTHRHRAGGREREVRVTAPVGRDEPLLSDELLALVDRRAREELNVVAGVRFMASPLIRLESEVSISRPMSEGTFDPSN